MKSPSSRGGTSSTTHIEQWLEKMLLVSFRHQAQCAVPRCESALCDGRPQDPPRFDPFSVGGPLSERERERAERERCFAQGFSALRELSLDREALTRCGADRRTQDALYRSLFVHCSGAAELVREWRRVDESLSHRLWDAILRVFSCHDPQAREAHLRFLADAQSLALRRTVDELRARNAALESENEDALQRLALAQVALSSLSHERELERLSLGATVAHLRGQLSLRERETDSLRAQAAALRASLRESEGALAAMKDALPQLLHRLQRALDKSLPAQTLSEHYRAENAQLQSAASKLRDKERELQEELRACRLSLIERNALVDALRERERELVEQADRAAAEIEELRRSVSEQRESEETTLSLVDELISFANRARERLAAAFFASLQCDRVLSLALSPAAAPLLCGNMDDYTHNDGKSFNACEGSNKPQAECEGKNESKSNVWSGSGLWIDEELLAFSLRESALPTRASFAVDCAARRQEYDSEGGPEGSNEEMEADRPAAIGATSSLCEKMCFLRAVREKIAMHLPLTQAVSIDKGKEGKEEKELEKENEAAAVVCLPPVGLSANFVSCESDSPGRARPRCESDGVSDNFALSRADSLLSQSRVELLCRGQEREWAAPAAPPQPDADEERERLRAVRETAVLLVCDDSLAERMLTHHCPALSRLSEELSALLPRLAALRREKEALEQRLSVSAALNNGIYTPMIAQLLSSREREHAQNVQLGEELQVLRSQCEKLEQDQRALLSVEQKYHSLEPKFLQLVEHYQQRSEAKKEVDDALAAAKREIEALEVQAHRLHICEERIEAMGSELEDKLRVITDLQEEMKRRDYSSKKNFR